MVLRGKVGDLELLVLDAGTFRLDGGAMFRVIPRVLWENRCPPDEKNRILLAMRPVLVRALDGSWVLVESGIGAARRDAKFKDMFDVRETKPLEASLAEVDVRPEQISKVVVSHMHFDHIGGVLPFTKAQLVVQKGELEDAYAGCDLCKASYVEPDWKALKDAGRLVTVDGDAEIAPGISVTRTGGHTRAHQIVRFESKGEKGVFWGDLVPTGAHLRAHYVMAYDLYPVACWQAKKELVPRAVEERWLNVFYHDPVTPFGRIHPDGRDFRVEAVA
jgi:glyoxylase-like metal-dependent hydrolase (beta-lactamase superfamily II)